LTKAGCRPGDDFALGWQSHIQPITELANEYVALPPELWTLG